MSDVVLVSLFSVAGTVLVASAGAIATIFGPAWRERVLRREERLAASDDLRYARALAYVEALAKLGSREFWHQTLEFHATRNAFVAVLRAGEGDVEAMTTRWAAAIMATNDKKRHLEIVNDASNQIFGWLRGDVDSRDFRVLATDVD